MKSQRNHNFENIFEKFFWDIWLEVVQSLVNTEFNKKTDTH
jgi:hypothetical protein